MSVTLLRFAKSFVDGRMSADNFVPSYLELWRIERDANILQQDECVLSECLSSIFCLADLHNADPNRQEYELDDARLLTEVATLIAKFTE